MLSRRVLLASIGLSALPVIPRCTRPNLSDAAGAADRWLHTRQRARHRRTPLGSMAVGKAGPTIHCRESRWCWWQSRHRSGGEFIALLLHTTTVGVHDCIDNCDLS